MPRPGPRPYECVRRAWHSDRHHPIRGSIIQQVFRLVTEAHSLKTKKNREWQEKLPIVVLKAEEIIYSKANSEAEYVDSETLWDRVNDAVNIIIRRDEGTETGELLPPCVEAALNLGCVPERASRSQRQSSLRTYLPPRSQESTSVAPRVFDSCTNEQCPPSHSGNHITFPSSTTLNPNFPSPAIERHVIQNNNADARCPFPHEICPPGINNSVRMESNASLNLGMVYPLYYDTNCLSEESQSAFYVQENQSDHSILIGTPIARSISEPATMGVLKNLFPCDNTENTLNRTRTDYRDNCNEEPGTSCDLSLRLGLYTPVNEHGK